MRLAIISDIHLGDESCHLDLSRPKRARRVTVKRIRKAYDLLLERIGAKCKYLIILGDGLDLSVCSYAEAYGVAKAFFKQLQKDGVTEHFIYVPGNHDADLWHICEHDVNVVQRIVAGREPREFRYSVPGIIDGRTTPADPIFQLHGASKDNEEDREWGYDSLFLNKLTTNRKTPDKDEEIKVALAYPNLYLLTDSGTILLTHGHYFEIYWSILARVVMEVAPEEVKPLLHDGVLYLKDFVAFNFPLNQLACTGIGQAGQLTELIIRPTQDAVKRGKTKRAEEYLDNLDNFADDLIERDIIAEVVSDFALNLAKRKIKAALRDPKPARGNSEFIHEKGVFERFKSYYGSTVLELDEIFKNDLNPGIWHPNLLIFGHTHEPVALPGELDYRPGPLYRPDGVRAVHYANTGGWLLHHNRERNTEEFCGARVITFDSSSQKLQSKLISEDDIAKG